MFPTHPHHSVDASPGTWYHASYTGLPVSRSDSPQSSNSSLVCTPYQSGRDITDISSTEGTFGYPNRNTSAEAVVGLGLQIPEPPTTSLLRRPLSEPAPEMLDGFGTMPFSLDYVQAPQNNEPRWRDADPGFPRLVESRFNHVYTQAPHPRQTPCTRSASNGGAGTSVAPLLLLGEADSLGHGYTSNLRSTVRSFSQPPGNYAHPAQESWGGSYPVADFPARGSQLNPLPEDYMPVSPIPRNEGEMSSPFQSRVGSDRTRAISSSRRSNPDKKLLHCPFPNCGATLTSRHNFKSHKNSHYGIKPHPCGQGQCNKRFGTTAEVKRHRANHCQYKP